MALRDLAPDAIRRNLLPAGGAVVVALVAWFVLQPLLFSDDAPEAVAELALELPPPEPVPGVVPEVVPEPDPARLPRVLVAKITVAAGVMLTRDMVEWLEWNESLAGTEALTVAVVQDIVPLSAIIGAVATKRFDAGAWITWDGLLAPGHPGFISAVLTTGMVGLTVEADGPTTSANIIYPGDRVDVIVIESSDQEAASSHTLAHGVRVLAVGSMVLTAGRYGSISVTNEGLIKPPPTPPGDNYTLELSPRDAERIALAARVGALTLSMRAVTSATGAGDPTPVRYNDVVPARDPRPPVRIIRGSASSAPGSESPT